MTDVAPRPVSLLDWVTGLVTDPTTRADFAADPRGTLDRHGLTDLDPADLHHAMPLVADTVAARVDTTVDGSATIPAVLDSESRIDALVRQFTSLSETVTPPDVEPHAWPGDTEVDDLDGPPPPGDHDLDDHVMPDHLDHGLDAMHDPENPAPGVATVSFLPSAPEHPTGPSTGEGGAEPLHQLDGHEEQDLEQHEPEQYEDHDLGHHEPPDPGHHDLGMHDLDAAP